jgi:hypothetical protein
MRSIPRKVHGVLDYLSVIGLFALPRMMHWSDNTTTLLSVLAGGTLLYSLLTRYELGALKVLPMKAHLVLDFLSGLALCALPFLYHMPRQATIILVSIGVFELIVSSLSDSTSLHRHEHQHASEAQPHTGR